MRTNRVLGLAAAAALVIAVASAAVVWAQATGEAGLGRHAVFGMRALSRLNYIGRQLGLTDEQKQQIKDIVRSHKTDIKALVDQGFAARKALREAVAAGDNQQIASAVNQVSEVKLKAAQMTAQIRGAVFARVLQPEQRARAAQLAAQIEQKADQRHQRLDQFIDSF